MQPGFVAGRCGPNAAIRELIQAGFAGHHVRLAKRGYVTGPNAASPAVTAMLPAYNMETFLGRALESVLGQTYPRLEVIVIDDGSTDGTRAIAEQFAAADERVRVVSVNNGGVAAARNLGTEMAATTYVAYLDADDLWHPEKIARQVAALAAHGHDGDWAGCYTLARYIDLDDCVLADGPSADARGDFFYRHLYRNHVGNGSSLLVRRDAALAVGGFNPDHARRGLGGVEDYEFQLKLLRRYKIEVVREFLVGYRIYPGQMSDDLVRMARARILMLEDILRVSDLAPNERARILTHARLTTAYRELRAGAWRLAGTELAGAFWSAPGAAAGLIVEMAALRLSRQKAAGKISSDLLSPAQFGELDPTDRVAATDNSNERPPIRLAALRRHGEDAAPKAAMRPHRQPKALRGRL